MPSSNGTTATAFEIPKLCKAGVVINEGPNFHVEVQMVPVPEPGPDEVLIRMNCTGICYSDLSFMKGSLGQTMSKWGVRSPGHEGAGVIVKIGSNVKNWKVGDRAGIKPMWYTCQNCELCWNDKETYCTKRLNSGMRVPGSYQQYVTSPASYTQPIPDGVDDYTAGPIMCSAATVYRSIIESKLGPGEWALFPGGGGGVGLQGVQIAAAHGMRPIVIDTGDEKRKLCLSLGAEAFIDFKQVANVAEEVIKIADNVGAHGIFVTAPQAYKNVVDCIGTRVGASIMAIGLPTFGDPISVGASPYKFIYQNLMIKGTLTASRGDITRVLDLAKRGKLKPISTQVYPIDQLPEAVDRLRNGLVAGRCLVDFNL